MKKSAHKKNKTQHQPKRVSLWRGLLQFFFIIPVIILFIVSFSFMSSQAHAAVGLNRVINFQGRVVKKADGTNVSDGTYSFTFKLYDAASSGNLLWQETQSSVSVTSGIFQVSLGSVTAFNTGGFNVDFKQNNLYLDITFNGETFGSRIQLASVPQAIDAEQLDGVVATQSASGFTLQGGITTPSTASFTTSGTTLTFQPGNAGGLTLQSNGANAVTLDTGAGAALNIGNTNATSLVIGNTANTATIGLNTSASTGNGVTITANGLTTGNGLLVTSSGSITGTGNLISLVGNSVSSGGALSISTTGITTGNAITVTGGSAVTTGGDLFLNGAVYQHAAAQTGSLATIQFTDNTNVAGASTTNGVIVNSTFNLQGASGAKAVNGIAVSAPTINGCTGGTTCTWNGMQVTTSTAGAASAITSNGLNIAATGISLGTINGINISSITQGAGTQTALAVGSGWNNVLTINGTAVITGTGGITVPSGQTLTLTGATVAGSPTWSANQAITLSTASQPNITSLGTLTSLTVSGALASGAHTITSSSANALAVGANGTTNPVFNVDASTASSATGLNIKSAAAGGGLAITTLSSGANENLTLDAKGTGILTFGGSSTGQIILGNNNGGGLGDILVQPNAGGKAALIVNDLGFGDIFTASVSGQTAFRITNTGGVLLQGDSLVASGSGSINGSAFTNALGDEGSMVPNAGFESAITGQTFADGWYAAATNSAAVTRDTNTKAKGTASAKVTLNASQSTAFYSTCLPLALGNSGTTGSYNLNWYMIGSSSSPVVRGYIDGYTSKGNCQQGGIPTAISAVTVTNTTNAWQAPSVAAIKTLGANVTWGRVHFFVGCPASCASNSTVNIDGVRLIENALTGGVDYAENYEGDPTNIPQPGDVVEAKSLNGQAVVGEANTASANSVMGVISTNPGEVLDDGSLKNPVTVALAGRVPVKVSTQNGPIHIGDYLTASTIPGVAVKAIDAGPVIGTALTDYTNSDSTAIGSVTLFIKDSYYAGSTGLTGTSAGIMTLIGTDTTSIQLEEKNNTLVIKGSDGSDAITFDNHGNATFTGIVSAKEIKADHIDGLEALSAEIASLSANLASTSAFDATPTAVLGIATTSGQLTIDSLSVNGLATISADLRVKGNSLVEGILNVIDTLQVRNMLISGISDFFGGTNFHDHVNVSKDTAGQVVVKQGTNMVQVTFAKPYDTTPVVTANIALIQPTNADGSVTSLNDLQQKIFSNNYQYIVTNVSSNGFTILLNKNASQDVPFTWTALGVTQ